MDPFSEFVVLAFLIVTPPVLLLRLFYRAIVREVSSWVPERTDRHRYQLVRVIPQRPTATASSAWWPRDRWSPPHGR